MIDCAEKFEDLETAQGQIQTSRTIEISAVVSKQETATSPES
jgi:hypothetical protein